MNLFRRYLADLRREFHGYSAKSLSQDLMAGLTVAAVALPLALAFGVSSGADAAAGLVTAIIAYTFVCLFTGNITPLSRVTAMLTPVWFVAELTLLCTLL